ncbi:MAG TPA: putative Ig domain-containing protein, partial [Candidatus Nanoarchaeia archaeon]|nr:putative Ig domain-containing protein [Candidatus Nanoarchaeia archaeon]
FTFPSIHAPNISTIPAFNISEDGFNATLNLSDFVSDIDNSDEDISWRVLGNQSVKVAINQATKMVNVSAAQDFNGEETLVFLASDGVFETASNAVIVRIRSVNDAPTINSVSPSSNPTITASSSNQVFNASYSDVEGDILNATWYRNLTIIAYNSSNATIANIASGSYNITLIVQDSSFASARFSWVLSAVSNIQSGNLSSPVSSLNETQRQNATGITVNSTQFGSINFAQNSLNFSGVSNLEDAFNISRGFISVNSDQFRGLNRSAILIMPGLSFVKTPLIYMAPGFESNVSAAICPSSVCSNISYNAANGRLEFSVAHFTSFIAQQNTTNGAPQITSTARTSAQTGVSYSYDVDAQDPDSDTLTYSLLASPSGMSIGSASGQISWTPLQSQIGANNITVRVSDGSLTGNQSFQINVTNGPKLVIEDVDVKVDGDSSNNLDNDSTISQEAIPGSKVTFKVKVANAFTDEEDLDIEDIEVSISLKDVDDGDDLEEDSDSFDLEQGREKTQTLAFDIPLEVDEDTYDAIITVEGRDDNGTVHETSWILFLDVEKERHELRILEATVIPATIRCEKSARVSVDVLNTGQEDEDDVVVRVDAPSLEFAEAYEAQLDSGSSDNGLSRVFAIPIPKDLEEGPHQIEVGAYYDASKQSDSKTLVLEKEECIQTLSAEVKAPLKTVEDAKPAATAAVVQNPIQSKPEAIPQSAWQMFEQSDSYAILLVSTFMMLTLIASMLVGVVIMRILR